MNREQWCEAAYRGMSFYACRLSGQREVAEDLTQEVFLKFSRAWKPEMEGWVDEQIWKWLLVILQNCYKDLKRHDSIRPHVSLDEALPLFSPQETDQMALLNVAFREAMRRIGPVKTRLLLNYYSRGVTPEELMKETGLSYQAITNRIYRARDEFCAAYRRG